MTNSAATLTLAWCVAAALLCSCDRGPTVLAPERGATWYEVRGPHFRVFTDLDRAHALRRLQQLEDVLTGYLHVGWDVRGSWHMPPINVVLMSHPLDVQEFAPDRAGYFVSDALFEPLAVAPASEDFDHLRTLKHELTHFIAYSAMPGQPAWLAEGLAEFFSTARYDDTGKFIIGGVPDADLFVLQSEHGAMPLRSLFAAQRGTASALFYASAWLLVHYLMMNHGDAFTRYQSALTVGHGFDRAWRHAFGDRPIEWFDHELALYLERRAFDEVLAPVATAPVASAVSIMTDADVYALRATLYRSCSPCRENASSRAREDVSRALAADPQNLRATVLQVMTTEDSRARLSSARKATRQHPGEWLTWLTLAFALETAPDHEPAQIEEEGHAVERLRDLAPWHAYGTSLASVVAYRRGQPEEALRLSARSVATLAPTPFVLMIRAALLAELHACDELAAFVARVGGGLADAWSKDASSALERACARCAAQTLLPAHTCTMSSFSE
jgi:hypothetical protein